MPKVFVCYSHDDGSWVRPQPDSRELPLVPWLCRKLTPRKIEFWWDEALEKEIGREFTPIIQAAIDGSQTAILLLSEDFFSSEYIMQTELPRILAREKQGQMQLFPIVLGRVDWNQNEEATLLKQRTLHPSELRPLKKAIRDLAEWDDVRSKLACDLAEQVLSFRPKAPEDLASADSEEAAARLAELEAEKKRSAEIEAQRAQLEREAAEARRREEASARRAEDLQRHYQELEQRVKDAAEAERQRAAETEKRIASEIAKAREEERRRFQAEVEKAKLAPPSAPSRTKPGELRTIDLGGGVTMSFRWCPAGKFTMGSPLSEEGRGADECSVEVTLTKGFWMGETPVTVRQFRAFVDPTGYRTEADAGNGAYGWTGSTYRMDKKYNWRTPGFAQSELCPVTCVSWADAARFADWSKTILPTEAQWEYACRAGTTSPFCFGPTITTELVNCDGNYPYGDASKGEYRKRTTPVGTFPVNRWGLRDMHGNVWEWCADWYDSKLVGGADPSGSAMGSSRVIRGGSWIADARYCRSAFRRSLGPGGRCNDLGFRVLLPGQ